MVSCNLQNSNLKFVVVRITSKKCTLMDSCMLTKCTKFGGTIFRRYRVDVGHFSRWIISATSCISAI